MASVRNSGKSAVGGLPSTHRIRQFLEETWIELRYKVSWPDPRTQLLRSTSVVLSVVVIVAVFVWFSDLIVGKILSYTLLRHR